MKIDPTTGLISTAQYFPSPNYDERPAGEEISLLVIHGISLPPGEFGGSYIHAFFSNQLDCSQHPFFMEIADLKVSSHLFIDRLGQLWQFVPFTKRAWHAGHSSFNGRSNCNNFSIGIELEGTDVIPYTLAQYEQLARVSQLLLQTYPKLTVDTIKGHSDIAPGRKTDPGKAFDWDFYQELLVKFLANKQNSQKTDIIR